LCEKAAQLGRCLELRQRIELLEGAGEGVRQVPHGPGREFRVLRLEVEPVDLGKEAPGSFQLAINKRRIEDQLSRLVGDLRLPPRLNLALQRLEVPLNPVHADRERVNQVETLGVLGQDRREDTGDNVSKCETWVNRDCRKADLPFPRIAQEREEPGRKWPAASTIGALL
jgi:hypothetical protein